MFEAIVCVVLVVLVVALAVVAVKKEKPVIATVESELRAEVITSIHTAETAGKLAAGTAQRYVDAYMEKIKAAI